MRLVFSDYMYRVKLTYTQRMQKVRPSRGGPRADVIRIGVFLDRPLNTELGLAYLTPCLRIGQRYLYYGGS